MTTSLLNSLSPQESAILHNVMTTDSAGCSTTAKSWNYSPLSDVPKPLFASMAGNPAVERWTGQDYLDWLQCCISHLSSEKGHPRWQIGGWNPPGVTVKRLHDSLPSHVVQQIRDLANAKGQVKLPAIQVAYSAGTQMALVGLPANLGGGSSISHLCDSAGCVEPNHLEIALQHRANLARQRCPGLIVFTLKGIIVGEQMCNHTTPNGSRIDRIQRCCRQLRVTTLDQMVK